MPNPQAALTPSPRRYTPTQPTSRRQRRISPCATAATAATATGVVMGAAAAAAAVASGSNSDAIPHCATPSNDAGWTPTANNRTIALIPVPAIVQLTPRGTATTLASGSVSVGMRAELPALAPALSCSLQGLLPTSNDHHPPITRAGDLNPASGVSVAATSPPKPGIEKPNVGNKRVRSAYRSRSRSCQELAGGSRALCATS